MIYRREDGNIGWVEPQLRLTPQYSRSRSMLEGSPSQRPSNAIVGLSRFRCDQHAAVGRQQALAASATREQRRAAPRRRSCRSPRQPSPSASSSARPDSARESPFRMARSKASAGFTACSPDCRADRLQGDRRPAGRSRLPAAVSCRMPGAEHLKALAAISRVTRNEPTLEKMRGARSRDALAAVLMGADERDAA